MKVELTNIGIATKQGKFELTIDEAKELYNQLHELFGKKPPSKIIIEKDTWPWWITPYSPCPVPPYPTHPLITWQSTTLPENQPIAVFCSGNVV